MWSVMHRSKYGIPIFLKEQEYYNDNFNPRASAEKFPGQWATEKKSKIVKKYRKIALLSLFQGEGATEKKTKK